ncbi:hypothetical protein ACFONG_02115 [Uliginosibacterium paludis]|uniref:Entry exclusion lipoprotein TrbK n=1 Tax=Uliginosibacterium paludis TaxID=1615952 RepID=A0ABV2CSN5_9RHOO
MNKMLLSRRAQLPARLLAAGLLTLTLGACSSAPKSGDDAPKVFCARETLVGTNIPRTKCRTTEEIKADEARVKELGDDLSRRQLAQPRE